MEINEIIATATGVITAIITAVFSAITLVKKEIAKLKRSTAMVDLDKLNDIVITLNNRALDVDIEYYLSIIDTGVMPTSDEFKLQLQITCKQTIDPCIRTGISQALKLFSDADFDPVYIMLISLSLICNTDVSNCD